MAGGWSRDGAEHEQMDATVNDALERARRALPTGISAEMCDECGKRFTTYEKIETIPLIIIKKDNNREAYDRAKIEAGVLRACHKRPVSAQQITTLVDEVENEIFNREEREIPSGTIGELVMNKLKDLDAVAYVRFASVYREFKDVNTFMDELKSVLNDKNPM